MRFTLTYDGDLPPSANKSKPEKVWSIRKALDPQLRSLWRQRPDLRFLQANSIVAKAGVWPIVLPHPGTDPADPEFAFYTRAAMKEPARDHEIDLCPPIARGSRTFHPLVRETLALNCGLKILFLRREARGRVYQGGDLDSRVKTLLDGLSIPQPNAPNDDDVSIGNPVYCLLEDDCLVTGIEVRSEQLLSAETQSETYVRLVIEVDVRVVQPRSYNNFFLGD
jgi:hypothetical protein